MIKFQRPVWIKHRGRVDQSSNKSNKDNLVRLILWGGDSSVGIRPTKKPGTKLTRIRVPGVARDFSPSAYTADLSIGKQSLTDKYVPTSQTTCACHGQLLCVGRIFGYVI